MATLAAMLSRTRLLLGPAAVALALLLAAPGGALTVASAPLELLLDEAPLVVHASVINAQSEPVPGQPGQHLQTRYTVLVWHVLEAQADTALPAPMALETLEVVMPGGENARYRTVAPGVPILEVGEELVLLLEPRPWSPADQRPSWMPLGYSLGVLPWPPAERAWLPGPLSELE